MENNTIKPTGSSSSFVSRHKVLISIIIAVCGVVVLTVGLVALQMISTARNSFDTVMQESSKGTFSTPGVPAMDGAREAYTDPYRADSSSEDDSSLNVADRKIIKTGHLSLIVGSTDDAVNTIRTTARSYDGFVVDENIYETSDNLKHGRITIKVPSDSFEMVMSSVKDIAVKVEQETVNTNDVTEEYIDLEARLTALTATEEQLIALLEDAENVEEVLMVRNELSNVRQQIERLEGRLRYLERNVDMSTISVNLVSEADVEVFGVVWSPMKEIKEGVRSMLSSLVSFLNTIIAFVFWLPALILWIIFLVLIGALLWKGSRLAYHKFVRSKH